MSEEWEMRGQPIVASRAAHLPEMNYDILHTLSAIKKALDWAGQLLSLPPSLSLALSARLVLNV